MNTLELQYSRREKQYFFSIVLVAVVSLAGYALSPTLGYRVVALMLLVSVSFLAMFFEIAPVMAAALLSALIWDYFFIPPRFTFTVGSTEDSFLLLMYFIVASVNAMLTLKIRTIQKEEREKEDKAKSLKFYSAVFNSLSHELRTPISTIIAASDNLISNKINLNDENKEVLVQEISKASLRLNEQVENLLNMSRLESGIIKPKKEWCDVNELVYSVIRRVEQNFKNRIINVHIPENLPLFSLDFVLIEQALYNLISNAVIYTPEETTITIEVDSQNEIPGRQKVIELIVSKLIIIITDNGKGFPENEIEFVFDKFYRLKDAKAGGTGLGLSIAKGFVEAHNGKIFLENITSGGARFKIEIPTETTEISKIKDEQA